MKNPGLRSPRSTAAWRPAGRAGRRPRRLRRLQRRRARGRHRSWKQRWTDLRERRLESASREKQGQQRVEQQKEPQHPKQEEQQKEQQAQARAQGRHLAALVGHRLRQFRIGVHRPRRCRMSGPRSRTRHLSCRLQCRHLSRRRRLSTCSRCTHVQEDLHRLWGQARQLRLRHGRPLWSQPGQQLQRPSSLTRTAGLAQPGSTGPRPS